MQTLLCTTLTSTMQNAINLAFIQQLGMLGLDRLQLDGDFFTCSHIGSEVNITKGTATNLAAQAVLFTDTQLHLDVVVVMAVE